MPARRLFFVSVLIVLSVLLLTACRRSTPVVEEDTPDDDKPKLAVLLVFDQLRADYLTRWQELFFEGGFQRLCEEGAWFQNCHYPYAGTMTGPGHASLATGCAPEKHGIIANDWYDRAQAKLVNCVQDDRHQMVPPPKDPKNAKGISPGRLLSPTLADALKDATKGKARVVALSLKDRSAVLPGGKKPDACYWADRRGHFVTSTYYRDRVHPWVAAFNKKNPADRWFGKTWQRARPDVDYRGQAGFDEVEGEGKGYGQGVTFPHPFTGGPDKLKSVYYAALANSPMGNDLLLQLTFRAIEAEKLGQRGTPDLLAVSFSSNDLVGHTWGPDSQEVLDTTLRTDRQVKELLDFLDRKVGKGKYIVAVSADHGVCPLPEVSRAKKLPGGRVDPGFLLRGAVEHLNETYPAKDGKQTDKPARWIEGNKGGVYLDRRVIAARGVKQEDVEQELAVWLRKQPGIMTSYTRTELLRGTPVEAVGRRVKASFFPARSGDVFVVEKYGYLLTTALTGTSHGTPHDYDTHVPLILYGRPYRGGIYKDAVTPLAAASALARGLGIDPPKDARAVVPKEVFAE